MKDGLHKGMTFPNYLAVDALTRRHLAKKDTWKRVRYDLDHPLEDTSDMALGRAVHAAVLEPDALERDFYFVEDYPYNTKEGKARRAEDQTKAGGRTVIRGHEALLMASAVHAYPPAVRLLKGADTEVSCFWHNEDDLCKARFDAVNAPYVIDLKTVGSASERAFKNDLVRFGYAMQAAWYMDGASRFVPVRGFAFILVEKVPPYQVRTFELHPEDLVVAERHMLEALAEYRRCRERSDWPGYPETLETLRIPAWVWGESPELLEF
jgi:hypothetical protein